MCDFYMMYISYMCPHNDFLGKFVKKEMYNVKKVKERDRVLYIIK